MQTEPSVTECTINLQELTAYKHFMGFNLFLYSRDDSKISHFLLTRASNTSQFTHYSGHFTKHDPNIFFAVAREFVTCTRGLLHSQNLQHFLAQNISPLNIDNLIFEKELTGTIRPQKGFTPAIDDICRLLCQCSHIFQDETDIATYFIEIPLLSLQFLGEAIKAKGLGFELKYFTLDQILNTEKIKVNEEVSEQLKACMANQKLLHYVQKFIVNANPVEITDHYAILSCDAVAKSSMLPSLHYSIYKKHGEKWTFYKAYDGELPTEEELKKMTGIIIPGSGNRAYDTEIPWYKGVFECICKIIREHTHINFLGICFGAQIAAQALGGRVEKMNRDFIRGGDLLTLQPTFYELEYLRDLGLDLLKPFVIGQAHGDHIVALPEGAICHASSANTKIEVYTIGNNVLGLQGHPEFNESWTAGAHYRMTKLQVDDYEKYADEYIQKTFPIPIPRDHILKICYNFLKKKGNVSLKRENS